MYRPEWFEKDADGRSVIDVALDVHMTTTGAFERSIDSGDQAKDIELLKHVLNDWKDPSGSFDLSVKLLIQEAIIDAEDKL